MHPITIYHNPSCSKSRTTLELIRSRGHEPIIVYYLKNPLNSEQLRILRAHFTLKDFVRIQEPIFKELNLSLEREEELLQAMSTAPILLQRPIVTYNNKAIIGRPPKRVLDLLS